MKAWIPAEKRYKYEKIINANTVKIEFIWDIRWKEALLILEYEGEIYELEYNPFSFVNTAKAFLKTIKQIERINTPGELINFIKTIPGGVNYESN